MMGLVGAKYLGGVVALRLSALLKATVGDCLIVWKVL